LRSRRQRKVEPASFETNRKVTRARALRVRTVRRGPRAIVVSGAERSGTASATQVTVTATVATEPPLRV
jgi:hypothetical protein